jgi:hypothetical protein
MYGIYMKGEFGTFSLLVIALGNSMKALKDLNKVPIELM